MIKNDLLMIYIAYKKHNQPHLEKKVCADSIQSSVSQLGCLKGSIFSAPS